MIKKTLLGASLSILLMTAFVTTEAKVDESSNADTLTALKATLKARFRSEPSSIQESVIPKLYQVMYGTEVVYVSADGKYFLAGDLINMDTRLKAFGRVTRVLQNFYLLIIIQPFPDLYMAV